ncbi:MAG: serine--tRNA ligase, partial [Methanosarcina sp.]|nr:serine--tRNA ligase [Methanosarcina sp.]MDD4523939.1 serine--tRNA ligase [Methanosarcina sp.]
MELQFNLKAYFKTSADPTPAKEAIAALFEEANNTLLTRGAPEGQGAKVTEWKLGEDRIELTLESGRYVRVHDAIFRLRKQLAEALGKKYKIGIRGI